MAKIFIEKSNGHIHEITDGGFVDTYYSFPDMEVVDIPHMTKTDIETACQCVSISYPRAGGIKTKLLNHVDGKYYLLKKSPDWLMKYDDSVLSSTYFDYPENLETEVA